MHPSSLPVLTRPALGRATLARQHLLERAALDPVAAIEAVGGLQAQEPASPYLALWTRLAGFAAPALDARLAERRVVKATLMRSTLHVVTADDYARLQPAMRGYLQGLKPWGIARPSDERMEHLVGAALAFAAMPRTNVALRDHLRAIASPEDAEMAWLWVRRYAAFVQVPTPGVPWSFGRRPTYAVADAWLPDLAFAATDAALEHLVVRYLGAFGPASVADMAAWSRLPVGLLRPAVAAVDARLELCRFADEAGRELLDLPDAPRPGAGVPAPPRLLPMWDSVLLAHADRTRVISDADRPVVVARNGDTLPTFLVDGRVGGLWWPVPEPGGRARIELEPFRPLTAAARRALESEGEALAAFVEPLEPLVYTRYRRSGARRAPGTPAGEGS